jgi:hypothetical protein
MNTIYYSVQCRDPYSYTPAIEERDAVRLLSLGVVLESRLDKLQKPARQRSIERGRSVKVWLEGLLDRLGYLRDQDVVINVNAHVRACQSRQTGSAVVVTVHQDRAAGFVALDDCEGCVFEQPLELLALWTGKVRGVTAQLLMTYGQVIDDPVLVLLEQHDRRLGVLHVALLVERVELRLRDEAPRRLIIVLHMEQGVDVGTSGVGLRWGEQVQVLVVTNIEPAKEECYFSLDQW